MRLIDADVLDKAFTALRFTADGELVHWGDRKDWCLHGSEVEALIADAPTVDAVPVIRCKDCALWSDADSEHLVGYCTESDCEKITFRNEWCCWAERRDEDEAH